jgi:hypothetical protein
VEKDAVDAVVRDGEQERCEGRVLLVEDQRRLTIEFVYFDCQIRAASRRHDERGDLCGALQRCPKVTNTCDAPASGTAIRNHHRVFGQH